MFFLQGYCLYAQNNQLKYFNNDSTNEAYHINTIAKDSFNNLYILADRFVQQGGGSTSYAIIKTDLNGNIIWNRELLSWGSGVGVLKAYATEIINNSIYILHAGDGSIWDGNDFCYLWKLDMNGNLIFSRKILNYDGGYYGNAVIKSNATHYFIAYNAGSFVRNFCFDFNDSLIWAKSIDIDSTDTSDPVFYDFHLNANGSITGIAMGTIGAYYECIFYNIKNDGSVNWVKKSYQPFFSLLAQFKTIEYINDNKYLIAGITNQPGGYHGILAIMDSSGNISNTLYTDQLVGGFYTSDRLSNGNILLRGNFDAGSVSYVTHYFELDTALNIVNVHRRSTSADWWGTNWWGGTKKFIETDSGYVFGLDTSIHFTPSFYNSCDQLWSISTSLAPLTNLIMSNTFGYIIDNLDTINYTEVLGLVNNSITSVTICDQPIGIEENENQNFMSIYPIPFTDKLNINSTLPLSRIEVYSLEGKQVLVLSNQLDNNVILDLSGLKNGMYLLYLFENGKIKQEKIIKQ